MHFVDFWGRHVHKFLVLLEEFSFSFVWIECKVPILGYGVNGVVIRYGGSTWLHLRNSRKMVRVRSMRHRIFTFMKLWQIDYFLFYNLRVLFYLIDIFFNFGIFLFFIRLDVIIEIICLLIFGLLFCFVIDFLGAFRRMMYFRRIDIFLLRLFLVVGIWVISRGPLFLLLFLDRYILLRHVTIAWGRVAYTWNIGDAVVWIMFALSCIILILSSTPPDKFLDTFEVVCAELEHLLKLFKRWILLICLHQATREHFIRQFGPLFILEDLLDRFNWWDPLFVYGTNPRYLNRSPLTWFASLITFVLKWRILSAIIFTKLIKSGMLIFVA